jgi:hypothetical protein
MVISQRRRLCARWVENGPQPLARVSQFSLSHNFFFFFELTYHVIFFYYFNQTVSHVSIFHPSLNGKDQFDTKMKG